MAVPCGGTANHWSVPAYDVDDFPYIHAVTMWNGYLVVGGHFYVIGGIEANNIALYDPINDEWSPFLWGFGDAENGLNNTVNALAVFEGRLVAGGGFQIGGEDYPISGLAVWDGDDWTDELGRISIEYPAIPPSWPCPSYGWAWESGGATALALRTIDNGDSTQDLLVSGYFNRIGGHGTGYPYTYCDWAIVGSSAANCLARIHRNTMTTNIEYVPMDQDQIAADIDVFGSWGTDVLAHDGKVYLIGAFAYSNAVLEYDGSDWTNIGTPHTTNLFNPNFRSLGVADGDLVVGGHFTSIDSTPALGVARWDGSDWSAMGDGLFNVDSLDVLSTGELVAVGDFSTTYSADSPNHIARWTGTAWAPFGDGTNGGAGSDQWNAVAGSHSVAPLANGKFYFGGGFTTAGGLTARGVALWRNCRADLNDDGVVDETDYVMFICAYNLVDCDESDMPAHCPADLNDDGIVEDADFTIFSAAYNAYDCP
ncbi:MAG: hypothetical protein KF691_06465 [Phycisphaeraceae bacterium]|nr:hypothetical protein [Phycisphaeraceae bacterium]